MKIVRFIISLLVIALVGAALYYFIYKDELKNPGEITITASSDSILSPKDPPLEYGIPIDSFFIVRQQVKRNQFLSHILSAYHIDLSAVDKIVKRSDGIFDFRKIKYGNQFTFFLQKDSSRKVKYVVYEHSPIDYVRISLNDSITIERLEKEIKIVDKKASGTIESSLWNTMINSDVNPMLAIELSEIYAWSIDFFGLQEGDSFNVVYEEQFVDTLSIGLGNIKTAYFKHAGNDFYAIPFEQDSVISFYDLEGNSLRKAFLKAPLRFSRISSRFSHSRLHPILKIRRPHHGVDYAAPGGTPVMAIGDGMVIKKGYYGGAGNMLKIKHNGVYTTAYLHLSGYGKGIEIGRYVKQGDIIGYVGSTGLSTGPHLDFRFYKHGAPIDPLKVEAPPVEPVHESNLAAFDSVKTYYHDLLNKDMKPAASLTASK
ncbi:MAG: peptidoglycan DD-metalloendopeptidase family protein [Bacteroidetes bacterium]|jgi:murein DD-endopeptidase MepM/ murein hydrolase activator NlpD|nr:peptidoglycan DD-metalloendopeptidase family protein [Bacteroidota bacterium]